MAKMAADFPKARRWWAIVETFGFVNRPICNKTDRAITEDEINQIFKRGHFTIDYSDLGLPYFEDGNRIGRIYRFETKKERDEYYKTLPRENTTEGLLR